MLLLIDNRDSFTWNLAQAFLALGVEVSVRRVEELSEAELDSLLAPRSPVQQVVVSPGPGRPEDTALSRRSLERSRGLRPWLGVCLGYQVLATAFGARVEPTGAPVHGKPDWIHHDGSGIFATVPRPFRAARYHSLHVVPETIPPGLRRVARTEDGTVMGLGVPGEPTWGVQFHPESFLTPDGPGLLRDFLAGVECPATEPPPGLTGARRAEGGRGIEGARGIEPGRRGDEIGTTT